MIDKCDPYIKARSNINAGVKERATYAFMTLALSLSSLSCAN